MAEAGPGHLIFLGLTRSAKAVSGESNRQQPADHFGGPNALV
jgi:hypothetical protein